MSERILLEASFKEGWPSVRLVAGDPKVHCFGVKHNYVILIDENGGVEDEWFYEGTHPMNIMESYWKFGREAERIFALVQGADPSADIYADLYSDPLPDDDEYK